MTFHLPHELSDNWLTILNRTPARCSGAEARHRLRDDIMRCRKTSSILVLVLLCGCSIFPPRPDPNFFTLSSEADGEGSKIYLNGAAPGSSTGIQLGLGPIKFPEYLDRLEIVTRIDDNRVAISDTDRWAAPLDGAFERVLAQDLSTRVPDCRIASYPWYGDRLPDFQVLVDVQRFDVSREGLAQLAASWTISDPKANTALYSTTSAISQSAGSGHPAEAAAALSRTLADFSNQIAFRIEQLNAKMRSGKQ
jgi:uncharacterized protein